MRDALTISAFAKRSGVPSKTIRYWEGLGLLPKAARSHTGYRVFDPAALRYVSFVQKSKAIGLTLAEMQEVLHLARSGRCPCPEVFGWTQAKAKSVAQQIRPRAIRVTAADQTDRAGMEALFVRRRQVRRSLQPDRRFAGVQIHRRKKQCEKSGPQRLL
ncbi:MAG: MerR family transcriptional regulator [Candidatus Acidiferrales bacterium]|jgi:DNA-binding transcriptional MerR regulator